MHSSSKKPRGSRSLPSLSRSMSTMSSCPGLRNKSFTVEYVGGPTRWRLVEVPQASEEGTELSSKASGWSAASSTASSQRQSLRPAGHPYRQKSESVALHAVTLAGGWGEKSKRELKVHKTVERLGYCPGLPRTRGLNESRLSQFLPPEYRAGAFLDLAPSGPSGKLPGAGGDSQVKIETREQLRILHLPPHGDRLMLKRWAPGFCELPPRDKSWASTASPPATEESFDQTNKAQESEAPRTPPPVRRPLSGSVEAAKVVAKVGAPVIDVNDPSSRVQQIFDRFDRDGAGCLDRQELEQVFKIIGDFSAKQIDYFLRELDKGGDGKVNHGELLAWINQGSDAAQAAYEAIKEETGESMSARVREVFCRFDVDGGGVLDAQELGSLFRMCSADLSTKDIDELLKELDKTNDGKVSHREFMAWLKTGSVWAKLISQSIVRETGNRREERIRKAFAKYDFSGDGTLEIQELRKTLKFLGSFSTEEVKVICADLDRSKDGEISYQEFAAWIRRGTGTKEVMKAKAILAPSSGDGLEAVFYNFCGAGYQELDGKGFFKLCQDCNLLDKTLDSPSIDLIFSDNKVKPKAQKRIDFFQFEVALELVAEKKGVSKTEVREPVLLQGGPKLKGTKTSDVNFDKKGR